MSNRFGKYIIERKIAVGGMAEIYLARTRSNERVALKRIHPNLLTDSKFVQMFLDEARTVIQLRHPNIVQLLDFGKVHDAYFFTMEWIDGKSLGEVVQQQVAKNIYFPVDVVLWIGLDICEGLAYAHVKRDHYDQPLGIVHRDISPPNVLVTTSCQFKVADFGIAEIRNKGVQTQPGVIRGKFSYMSPEQSYGDPLDHRSDLFSVGVVLYELLVSKRLFLRENEQATIEAVRKCNVPPLRKSREDVPEELNDVLQKVLSNDAKDRYPDAPSFADDLARILKKHYPQSSRQVVKKYLNHLFPMSGFHMRDDHVDIAKKRLQNVDPSRMNTKQPFPIMFIIGIVLIMVLLIIGVDYMFGFFQLGIFS
ncbi:MAG: serine/threonine-protein kinase [Bdellovibrionota bacterium]